MILTIQAIKVSTRSGGRIVLAVAGVALVVLAVVWLLIFLAAVTITAPFAELNGEQTEFWSLFRIARRVVLIAIPFVVIYAGLVLAEGRKVSVLYLRRFGRNVNVIGPRYRRGLGRNIRLITLDDRKFSPSEAPILDRWLSRFVPMVVLALLLVVGALLVGSEPLSEGNLGTRLAIVLALAFVTGIAFFILFALLLHAYRMRHSSRLQVNSAIDLRAMIALARGASAWWSRPALLGREATVISVSDELWQAAVQALSHHTNVVIVDASDRSAHVEWELNLLRAEHVPHVMIVERGSPRDAEQGVGLIFTYDHYCPVKS